MRNLKRWKRLMAVAMCSAMMLSVPMGVSATDSGDTKAPVTDNAEIVDTDTPDDTDTDTSDDTDTPDGSGDVNVAQESDKEVQPKSTENVTPKDKESVFEISEDGTLVNYIGMDEEVIIPEGVTNISELAFRANDTMRKVVLPETFQEFATYAFRECTNLKEVLAKSNRFRFRQSKKYFNDNPIEIHAYNRTNASLYCEKYENLTYVDAGDGSPTIEWDKKYSVKDSPAGDGITRYGIDFGSGWYILYERFVKVYVNGKEYGLNGKIPGTVFEEVDVTAYPPMLGISGGVGGGGHAISIYLTPDIFNENGTANVKVVVDELDYQDRPGAAQGIAKGIVIEFVAKDITKSEVENQPSSNNQYVADVPEGKGVFSIEEMQNFVNINKDSDVVFRTPEGVEFRFEKGTMHMVEGMENYPFGVDLITDYSKSGINDSKITEDTFAFRINYEYSGELPGTARISIPVNSKWNGSTLYYYQIMPDGTLKDTGRNSRVTNGIFNVYQTHCSDYVLLANSPKELGLTSTKVPTSPKTGDTSTAMLFMILCMGACLAGAGAVKVKCNNR